MQRHTGADFYYFTTKGDRYYYELTYTTGCYIVFGKETAGLPDDILAANHGRLFRIPMRGDIRSLNLSNSVAIVVYEAMRQNAFRGLA
jgi:tRNA (cytidine/uridine-2'-O-)-methyltransferase